MDWSRAALVALGVLALSWTVVMLMASRVPPGLRDDLAEFLPCCVPFASGLRADPRVPRRAKLAVTLAALWVVSPIDLIPEFIPVLGPLDDLLILALALRYASRRIDPRVLREAWPTNPTLLLRLIGPTAARWPIA